MWKKEAVRKVRVLREVQDADDDEVQDGDEDEDAHDDDGDEVTRRMLVMMGWFDDPSNSTGALCSRLSADAGALQGVSTKIGPYK